MNEQPQTKSEVTGSVTDFAIATTIVKLAQISLPIVLAALIPWGSWVTYKVIAIDEWKNIGPRFTASDAVAMETRVKAESSLLYVKVGELASKLDTLNNLAVELKVMVKTHIDLPANRP